MASFAEVDEHEIDYYNSGRGPAFTHYDNGIHTDDFRNALPEALRSPPKQKPVFGLRSNSNANALPAVFGGAVKKTSPTTTRRWRK
jgi:hypothetical protein